MLIAWSGNETKEWYGNEVKEWYGNEVKEWYGNEVRGTSTWSTFSIHLTL